MELSIAAHVQTLKNRFNLLSRSLMFRSLPSEPSAKEPRSARVCIATYEILGPSKNGGIGTAYYSLATTLAAANHHVTILYLWAARSDQSEMRYWQGHFRTLGITFVPLPASSGIAGVPDCMQTARDAHAWLRKQEFDIIHFPELHGHGYYCVLAKHQGLDFSGTVLCIGTHSPISWIREQNKEAPYSAEELEMDFMERQCVGLADVVVSPSQYMLGWMRSHGWVLPAASYVQQNIAPGEPRTTADLKRSTTVAQRAVELVFFGRLEARKGIGLFCDALDFLKGRDLPGFSATFLGRRGRIHGRDSISYIKARAARWAFPFRIITEHGREAALEFLSEDASRIAVIPSFEDNLPYTVIECLARSIPFLAGRGGGVPELIAPSDLNQVTFPPDAVQFADRLALAIRDGIPVARPAIDADENRQQWIKWHAAMASRRDDHRQAEHDVCARASLPTVSVCLDFRGDYELLRQSLESLRRQTYRWVEVLLSDYSASGADAAQLDHLINDFEAKGWRLVSRPPPNCSSAPTLETRGEHVLFMEASDCLSPDAVATFVSVACSTGADVLTCFLALFNGRQEPAERTYLGHYPFLGKAVLSGIFRNHFGGGVIFVKKDALVRLGSFPGDSPRECADWEFLARAALMDCRMEVIPYPLAWHRISDHSKHRVPLEYLDQVRALKPYAQLMPAALRDLPKAALTMGLHYSRIYKQLGDSPAHAILQHLSMNRNNGSRDLAGADEGALLLAVNRMPKRARKKIVAMLDGWLEYTSARAQLPARGLQRIPHITRQLVRGHYHRYAHGFGSALRDLRKPSQPR
jgi:O-antigen biosynthesis protein